MDRLGGLVVIAPAGRAGDPGSNPGPNENFSFTLLIYIYIPHQKWGYAGPEIICCSQERPCDCSST